MAVVKFISARLVTSCTDWLFLGVIHVVRGHKNPKLLLDKNEFVINHKFRDKTRWRCTSYYKTKCRCVLVTHGKVVNVVHDHNHSPSIEVCNYDNLFSQKVSIIRN
jgi:hypothetical protein